MEPSGFAGTNMEAVWKRIMGTWVCLDIRCFCVWFPIQRGVFHINNVRTLSVWVSKTLQERWWGVICGGCNFEWRAPNVLRSLQNIRSSLKTWDSEIFSMTYEFHFKKSNRYLLEKGRVLPLKVRGIWKSETPFSLWILILLSVYSM